MPESVQNPQAPRTCPRCSGDDVRLVARSPKAGVWTMHLCSTCHYSWRSTEPAYATSAGAKSPGFRIDAKRIGDGLVMPVVPPLRSTEGG